MSLPTGWKEVDGRLMRAYEFPDFLSAKSFIDAVSEVCESHQHHAEFHFGWGYVVIESYTHDSNSITAQDIALANAINLLETDA